MPRNVKQIEHATLQAASHAGGKKRGVCLLKAIFLNCALAVGFCGFSQAGTYLTLSSAGISGGGGGSTAYTSSFGTVDALAVNGATVPGVTGVAETSPNGALYYMPITANLTTKNANSTVFLTAYVSTNFNNPAALVMYACPSTANCNGTSGYSLLSTNSGAPASIVPSPGVMSGASPTIGVALWVPDNNGASAWTGTDTANATITFTVIERKNSNGNLTTLENDTLTFNMPKVTLQTAVSMDLQPNGGLPISGGIMSFSPVNGLGVGLPPGGTTVVTVAGGVIYTTPYQYNVIFTDFPGSPNPTGTVDVYVSSTFADSILALDDSAAAGGPYSAISTISTSPTQITNAALSRSTTSRYLGLYICNLSTCTNTLTGTFSATLTYQLTVP